MHEAGIDDWKITAVVDHLLLLFDLYLLETVCIMLVKLEMPSKKVSQGFIITGMSKFIWTDQTCIEECHNSDETGASHSTKDFILLCGPWYAVEIQYTSL